MNQLFAWMQSAEGRSFALGGTGVGAFALAAQGNWFTAAPLFASTALGLIAARNDRRRAALTETPRSQA